MQVLVPQMPGLLQHGESGSSRRGRHLRRSTPRPVCRASRTLEALCRARLGPCCVGEDCPDQRLVCGLMFLPESTPGDNEVEPTNVLSMQANGAGPKREKPSSCPAVGSSGLRLQHPSSGSEHWAHLDTVRTDGAFSVGEFCRQAYPWLAQAWSAGTGTLRGSPIPRRVTSFTGTGCGWGLAIDTCVSCVGLVFLMLHRLCVWGYRFLGQVGTTGCAVVWTGPLWWILSGSRCLCVSGSPQAQA